MILDVVLAARLADQEHRANTAASDGDALVERVEPGAAWSVPPSLDGVL